MPRTRSQAAAARETSAQLAELIQKPEAQQRKIPYGRALPKPGRTFATIVDRLFAPDFDPAVEEQELRSALSMAVALTPGELEKALERSDAAALRAHRLYIVAKVDYERFEIQYEAIADAMRTEALRQLQAEKDAKLRSKVITEADIRGRCALLYPDEWRDACECKARYEGAVAHLKELHERLAQRSYSLGQMLGRRRQ
jgi:hypothetical protein